MRPRKDHPKYNEVNCWRRTDFWSGRLEDEIKDPDVVQRGALLRTLVQMKDSRCLGKNFQSERES